MRWKRQSHLFGKGYWRLDERHVQPLGMTAHCHCSVHAEYPDTSVSFLPWKTSKIYQLVSSLLLWMSLRCLYLWKVNHISREVQGKILRIFFFLKQSFISITVSGEIMKWWHWQRRFIVTKWFDQFHQGKKGREISRKNIFHTRVWVCCIPLLTLSPYQISPQISNSIPDNFRNMEVSNTEACHCFLDMEMSTCCKWQLSPEAMVVLLVIQRIIHWPRIIHWSKIFF